MTYDLIVIGAGPAGGAAAISAARNGAEVLLLERAQFPRHKVCGEFVSAESLELLSELLLPEGRGVVTGAFRIGDSRIFADLAVLRARINPAAASIARYELDRALWNSASKVGVDARDRSPVLAIEGSGPFVVSANGTTFTGKTVVNAAGRWSFLTHSEVRSRATADRWIGMKAHFREERCSNSVDLYFFEGGYCGVQPVWSRGVGEEVVVNACAMVRADVANTLHEAMEFHPALRARSRNWDLLMDPVSTSPLVFHLPEAVRGNMLQAGDAATFVDPFVGDGISLALRSGRLAAESLQPFFAGECSLAEAAKAYATAYAERLSRVFRVSSTLRKFLGIPAAIRRPVMSLLQRTPLITTQLVRLTR
jgi:flavin-dependent dehydrogenase